MGWMHDGMDGSWDGWMKGWMDHGTHGLWDAWMVGCLCHKILKYRIAKIGAVMICCIHFISPLFVFRWFMTSLVGN